MEYKTKKVIKQVLSNGLTVLIKPAHAIPKVSTQLWYNVGSKDEMAGEKGIAHLIEHMIFKGTQRLSECDINLITHKLSGYTNAFTSYDYTGYLFDFPTQHWKEALPIMADCMHNASFKEEHLASELKAVIQELKMYRDDYNSSILEALLSAIFPDHPYHHPIIGYKQDLWNLKRETLVRFYQKHYQPNNATLVIVGDVDVKEAAELAHINFDHLHGDFSYKKEQFYHSPDLRTQFVTLYRDIAVPLYILAWEIPGANASNDYLVDIVGWLLGSGKGSRLYKKLVDELQLVTTLDAFNYDLFEYGVFFIYFQPKNIQSVEKIIEIIQNELQTVARNGVTDKELTRAVKQAEVEYLTLLENNQKQAYTIGKYYLALSDEEYLYTFTQQPHEELNDQAKEFVQAFLRPSLMHQGRVLPLTEEEKCYWVTLQEISDQEDTVILARRTREESIEEGRCVLDIKIQPPKTFSFPRPQRVHLENGLKVLYSNNATLPKIDLVIDFEAKQTYDPKGKEGLSAFVAAVLLEGTKNYTAQEFSDTVETYGMTLSCSAGLIAMSLLSQDLPKALELINEMLTQATFSTEAIEKVRDQMLFELKEYWDTPTQFVMQLARKEIYKEHPYSKNQVGTFESITSITREDLLNFYTTYLSPRAARMAIVGDCERYEMKALLEDMLHAWQGPEVPKIQFPVIEPIKKHMINYPILRDQTVLCYAGISVARPDKDYEKLLLFDQIFTGGILGSMASRLFDLREQSGLFYTIGGSLISRVDEDKGLIIVKTIVSNDRLKEAEVAIEHLINTATDSVTDDEFTEAQQAIANSLVDNFASNYQTASTLLFMDKFGLPEDYYDKRAQQLMQISKEEMQQVAKKYLNVDRFILVRVGRAQV